MLERLGCVSFNPRNTPIQINRSSRRLISIYVHYPYCTSKCTYCNFNKYTLPANLNYLRLEKAYLTDLTHDLSELDQTKQTINSIYFGGGTPSLAKPTLVENILKLLFIDLKFKPAVDLEVTLEANPTRLEAQSLKDFKAAGVNRLSLGIQSLDNDDLKFFGRDHNVNEALQAITLAQSLFENVSLDFIWGRPGHTTDQWESELSQILSFGANHLSLYQLTVENGTPLAKLASKPSNRNLFPCEDTLVDMFQLTQELTQRGGYGQYEVSSYAKDSLSSNRSKHNQGYWNGNDYIGIGPGAHGRLFKADNIRYRTYRALSPSRWIEQCENVGHGIVKTTTMTKKDIQEELIMFGMRAKQGINATVFETVSGGRLEDILDMEQVTILTDAKLIHVCHNPFGKIDHITPSKDGLILADMIARKLIK